MSFSSFPPKVKIAQYKLKKTLEFSILFLFSHSSLFQHLSTFFFL